MRFYLALLIFAVAGLTMAVASQPSVPAKEKLAVPAREPAVVPGSPKAWSVPGLDLDAPQKRTRPGLVNVTAKVTAGKPDSKIRIIFDVEAIWDDEDVETEWEVRDSGTRLQVVIPDSSGIIRISAVAIVDGEPTSDRFAKTTIEVTYAPRVRKLLPDAKTAVPAVPAAETKAGSLPPPVVTGKVVKVYFVVDPEGDPNINDLVKSVGLRNRLRAVGIEPKTVGVGDEFYRSKGLERFVKDAGGAPAMIGVTADGKVRVAKKVPVTAEGVVGGLE